MTELKNRFKILLVIIGLAFDPFLGAMQAQAQSGPQPATAVSILTRVITRGWTTNLNLSGHIDLIRSMVPVGLEMDDRSGSLFQSPYDRLVAITISNETLSSAIQKITDQYADFTWHFDHELSCVDVYPRKNALCFAVVPACSITNQSLEWIFTSDLPALKGLNIHLYEGSGRFRPIYRDVLVDVEFKGGPLIEFLNQLTSSVGGANASWTLKVSGDHALIHFDFLTDPTIRASDREPEYKFKPLPISKLPTP